MRLRCLEYFGTQVSVFSNDSITLRRRALRASLSRKTITTCLHTIIYFVADGALIGHMHRRFVHTMGCIKKHACVANGA